MAPRRSEDRRVGEARRHRCEVASTAVLCDVRFIETAVAGYPC